ncbi:hypothetical protein ACQ4WX_07110 [Streptomyces lasalocidi]
MDAVVALAPLRVEIGRGARAEADLPYDDVAVRRCDPLVDPRGRVLVVEHLRRGHGGEGRVGLGHGRPVGLGDGDPDATDGAVGGAYVRDGALAPLDRRVGLGGEGDDAVLEVHGRQDGPRGTHPPRTRPPRGTAGLLLVRFPHPPS